MSNIIESLKRLGLSSKQATIYLACLEIGETATVSTISRVAKMNRTTVNYMVDDMVEMGLLIRTKSKNHSYKTYRAQPPEKLISYLEQKSEKFARLAREAQQVLPELKSHYRGMGWANVYFYEGEEGLIRVYEETLSATEEIRAYASDKANQAALAGYFPIYYKRRAEKGIPIRALFTDSPEDRERYKLDEKELRTSRLLPKEKFGITPEVNFFDNKIMIADWKEKLGIIIESEEIAKVFKQTFELAWEAAEKYHNIIVEDIKKSQKKKN